MHCNNTRVTVAKILFLFAGLHGHCWKVAALLILQHAGETTCIVLVSASSVGGDWSGVTIWRVDGSSECVLSHSTAGAKSKCGPDSAFRARPGTGFGTNATSFSVALQSQH